MDEQTFLAEIASNDEQRQIKAVRLVAEKSSISMIKSLIPVLRHPNRNVAREAVIGSANLIRRQLVEAWADIDKGVKDGLATLLKRLDPIVIDHIAAGLKADDEDVRLRSLQVLGLLGQSDKIKQVVSEMLTDNDEKMRATAVSVLKEMLGGKDLTLIYRVLHDPDPRVRANGVEALELAGNKTVVPTLSSLRRDPNNRVRGNVIKALYMLGFKKVDTDVREMVEHKNHLMRATAFWVLGEISKSAPEPWMVDIAGEYGLDRNPLVRQNAIKTLIKINTPFSKQLCKFLFDVAEIKKAIEDMERMAKIRGK
ncbi:MAG: HEAT repeat domain-containing protein [Fibrobacteres bacterium]|nr:HEAT repeat domain-containing protein [Fibrobacterota bacterium]